MQAQNSFRSSCTCFQVDSQICWQGHNHRITTLNINESAVQSGVNNLVYRASWLQPTSETTKASALFLAVAQGGMCRRPLGKGTPSVGVVLPSLPRSFSGTHIITTRNTSSRGLEPRGLPPCAEPGTVSRWEGLACGLESTGNKVGR